MLFPWEEQVDECASPGSERLREVLARRSLRGGGALDRGPSALGLRALPAGGGRPAPALRSLPPWTKRARTPPGTACSPRSGSGSPAPGPSGARRPPGSPSCWAGRWEEWPVLLRLDRRLQTLAVCELLIENSFEEGFRDAARAIELAELGLLLAGLLDGERYGRSVVQDLQARAWAYLGNARRIAFDLTGAEEALARAERLAEGGSADPLEEARILDLRASLLSDQGRFEQAAELLDVVIDIYDELHEPHRKGRAMISKGVFLGYAGWPEEAIRQIRKGLGLVDWDREPRLVLMARHNLAWFLNDCGRAEEALRQLERFRHTYREFPDSWTALRLAWLEGRIAGRPGPARRGRAALREVRQPLPRRGARLRRLAGDARPRPPLPRARGAPPRCASSRRRCSTSSSPRTSTARPSPPSPSSSGRRDGQRHPGLVAEISSYLVRARQEPAAAVRGSEARATAKFTGRDDRFPSWTPVPSGAGSQPAGSDILSPRAADTSPSPSSPPPRPAACCWAPRACSTIRAARPLPTASTS